MREIRYNNQIGILGSTLDANSGSETVSNLFMSSPDFETISPGDYVKLCLDADPIRAGVPNPGFEIVYLTAFVANGLGGTILRGQEGTTPVFHFALTGTWSNSPTVDDFLLASAAAIISGGDLGSTHTVDFDGNPNTWFIGNLTASLTLGVTGLPVGGGATLLLQQNAVGGWGLTIDGTPITIPITPNTLFFVHLWTDGTNLYVDPVPQVGPTGPVGITGPPGNIGSPGPAGKSTWIGTADPPANSVGNDGDGALSTTFVFYGPKAGGVWPVPGQPLLNSALPVVSTLPAPITGKTQQAMYSQAGRGMPTVVPEIGTPYALGAAIYAKTFVGLLANVRTTTPVVIGNSSAAATGVGTVTTSGAGGANGLFMNIASAATAAALAYVRADTMFRTTLVTTELFGGYLYKTRLFLPDASYTNGSGARWSAGMSSNALGDLGADHGLAASRNAMFAWSAATADTNWQFVTSDGTAQTITDTTIPFVAQHVYSGYIYQAQGSGTVTWTIRDLTAGTVATGSTASHVPGAALAPLAPFAGICTIDATARNFQYSHIFCESDKG